jgi:hypothetical protein
MQQNERGATLSGEFIKPYESLSRIISRRKKKEGQMTYNIFDMCPVLDGDYLMI